MSWVVRTCLERSALCWGSSYQPIWALCTMIARKDHGFGAEHRTQSILTDLKAFDGTQVQLMRHFGLGVDEAHDVAVLGTYSGISCITARHASTSHAITISSLAALHICISKFAFCEA